MSEIGISIHTERVLAEQTIESRRRNIREEVLKQLEMQFGLQGIDEAQPLSELLGPDELVRLNANPHRRFPFLKASFDAAHLANVQDVILTIFQQVRPAHLVP